MPDDLPTWRLVRPGVEQLDAGGLTGRVVWARDRVMWGVGGAIDQAGQPTTTIAQGEVPIRSESLDDLELAMALGRHFVALAILEALKWPTR